MAICKAFCLIANTTGAGSKVVAYEIKNTRMI